jgi:hypothetical protein
MWKVVTFAKNDDSLWQHLYEADGILWMYRNRGRPGVDNLDSEWPQTYLIRCRSNIVSGTTKKPYLRWASVMQRYGTRMLELQPKTNYSGGIKICENLDQTDWKARCVRWNINCAEPPSDYIVKIYNTFVLHLLLASVQSTFTILKTIIIIIINANTLINTEINNEWDESKAVPLPQCRS